MNYSSKQVKELTERLNQYRHEYYNENTPSITDAVYDRLFDELKLAEQMTGITLSTSPTQTVGYKAVSKLKKVKHPIPLLSLDKTKSTKELLSFLNGYNALLMLKLDGLTIKLVNENGKLIEGSTRGNGEEGELVTHNIPAFCNVPLTIPYKERLIITGEGFIHKSTFERLKDTLIGSDGKPYHNARNLAAGSIRCFDATSCKEREIHFSAFNVLEGFNELGDRQNSRMQKLFAANKLGFDICPHIMIAPDTTEEQLKKQIASLKDLADLSDIPIDGMVLRFDNLTHSKSLGRTGHHYKDGLAFKFEDDMFETVLRSIEWQTGRSGEITPVAVFDTVEIDGCEVSRATLHNISFIKQLELYPNCRILVSKRNMIIPHVEENLDRGHYQDMIPKTCPCCGKETRISSRSTEKNRLVETLHCDNPNCAERILQKFVHFSEKKAMNIKGLSKATLEKFIQLGYLKTFSDLYHLDKHKEQIISLDGFGIKSYEKLKKSITESRNTTFAKYLVAIDIPLIGKTASREIEQYFNGNLQEFETAALESFDFTTLADIGEIMRDNIHKWFQNPENLLLWQTLQKEFNFKERNEDTIMTETKKNPFTGCTIVATGKLSHFTRDGINSKIASLGAVAGSSVTKKTDYLICGEKAGSKLKKAEELGVTILSEQQFLDMLSA